MANTDTKCEEQLLQNLIHILRLAITKNCYKNETFVNSTGANTGEQNHMMASKILDSLTTLLNNNGSSNSVILCIYRVTKI